MGQFGHIITWRFVKCKVLQHDLRIWHSPSTAATTAWRWGTSSDLAAAHVCSPALTNPYTHTNNNISLVKQHTRLHNKGGDQVDSYTPDDLGLLLRSARPEAQDYVANLGEDKHKDVQNAVFCHWQMYKLQCKVYSPGKADLKTHWLKRSSHSRSGSPPGSGDPAVNRIKIYKVQHNYSLILPALRFEWEQRNIF